MLDDENDLCHWQFIAGLHVANVDVLFMGEAPDGVLAVS